MKNKPTKIISKPKKTKYGIDKGCHVCYVLKSEVDNYTYCGYTMRFDFRIQCHNGERKAPGAKTTNNHRPWKPLFILKGFQNKRQGLQFEKAFHMTRSTGRTTIVGRIKTLYKIINKERWTRNSPLAEEVPLTIFWYSKEAYTEAMNLITEWPAHISHNTTFIDSFLFEMIN